MGNRNDPVGTRTSTPRTISRQFDASPHDLQHVAVIRVVGEVDEAFASINIRREFALYHPLKSLAVKRCALGKAPRTEERSVVVVTVIVGLVRFSLGHNA